MEKSVIALIGPSGAGKSSIGRNLAKRLNWEFLDSDREIEQRSGQAVSHIFQNLGEAEFRARESALLDELVQTQRRNLVFSTGGGLPVFGQNFAKLESIAIVVYLTAPLEVLVTRISQGEERPLLAQGASQQDESSRKNAAAERLGKLIQERESIYNRARYKIDTSATKNVEDFTDDIIRLTGIVIE